MEKRYLIVILILFGIALVLSFNGLSGEITRTTSKGGLIGEHVFNHPEREKAEIEIKKEKVNKDGLPVVKKGKF